MYKSLIFLAGLAAAYPTMDDLVRRQYPSKPCSKQTGGLHIIATPGEGNANPPYGLIGSLSRGILNALPGSTNVSVPYNKADPVGTRQTSDAAVTIKTYIQQYQQSCPYTRIVLLGYSAGAIANMNVLCGETNPPFPRSTAPLSIPTYSGNLVAAVNYGDETFTAGASFNRGTCQVSSSKPRSEYARGRCETWGQILRNYCDADDNQCCTTGTSNAAHYTYPQRYDQQAINFVVSQFRARGP